MLWLKNFLEGYKICAGFLSDKIRKLCGKCKGKMGMIYVCWTLVISVFSMASKYYKNN